mmetsp:Transcript_28137/g.52562  ORF Transcript_28137/g.52562 Transcript_28137/m.52562 type:complete len:333 (-) Transcript_28137:279-1277(-)
MSANDADLIKRAGARIDEKLKLIWDFKRAMPFAYCDISASSSAKTTDITLNDILSDCYRAPLDLQTFYEHCCRSRNEELLLFVTLIRRFRKQQPKGEAYGGFIDAILRHFLEEDSSYVINISGKDKEKTITTALDSRREAKESRRYNWEVFERAEKEVQRMIKHNIFPNFKQTAAVAEAITRLRKGGSKNSFLGNSRIARSLGSLTLSSGPSKSSSSSSTSTSAARFLLGAKKAFMMRRVGRVPQGSARKALGRGTDKAKTKKTIKTGHNSRRKNNIALPSLVSEADPSHHVPEIVSTAKRVLSMDDALMNKENKRVAAAAAAAAAATPKSP